MAVAAAIYEIPEVMPNQQTLEQVCIDTTGSDTQRHPQKKRANNQFSMHHKPLSHRTSLDG